MCGTGPCGPRQGAFTLPIARRARQCLALGTGMGSNISDCGGHSGYPCPGMGGTDLRHSADPGRLLRRNLVQGVRSGRSGVVPQGALNVACERRTRSEEHTSELQSLMRISYAVFCLKKQKKPNSYNTHTHKPP